MKRALFSVTAVPADAQILKQYLSIINAFAQL